MEQKQEKKVEEEDQLICAWCGENCEDGCWVAIENEVVCDACIETL